MHLLALHPSLPLSLPWDGRMRERTVGELDKPHTLRPRDVGRAGGRRHQRNRASLPPSLPFLAHQEIGRRRDGHRGARRERGGEGRRRRRGCEADGSVQGRKGGREGGNRRNRQSRRLLRLLASSSLSTTGARTPPSGGRTRRRRGRGTERRRKGRGREGSKKQARGRRASRGERASADERRKSATGRNRKRRRLKRGWRSDCVV